MLPESLDWLPTSFEGFRNLVIGVLSAWLVGLVIGFGRRLVESVQIIWSQILFLGGTVGSVVGRLASAVAMLPEALLAIVEFATLSVASAAGPLAPLAVAVMWSLLVILMLVGVGAVAGIARGLVPI